MQKYFFVFPNLSSNASYFGIVTRHPKYLFGKELKGVTCEQLIIINIQRFFFEEKWPIFFDSLARSLSPPLSRETPQKCWKTADGLKAVRSLRRGGDVSAGHDLCRS